jgi:hypothetical protein
MIDKACGTLSFSAIILAFGISPYFTPVPALMLLISYLLHNVYILIRTVVDGVRFAGFSVTGPSWARLLFGLWAGALQIAHVEIGDAGIPASKLEVASGCSLAAFFAIFIRRALVDYNRLQGLGSEGARLRQPAPAMMHLPMNTANKADSTPHNRHSVTM